MKANRHYPKMDCLEIKNIKIKNNKCTRISVQFVVDALHILLAIATFSDAEKEKLTRIKIEKQLKNELFYKGEMFYLSPIDYGESGDFYNLDEELEKSLPIGKKFFPEFFDVPNSIKFIKDIL